MGYHNHEAGNRQLTNNEEAVIAEIAATGIATPGEADEVVRGWADPTARWGAASVDRCNAVVVRLRTAIGEAAVRAMVTRVRS